MNVRGLGKLKCCCFELRRRNHLVFRGTDLVKEYPSIPRHPINRREDISPTEMRKCNDEIVQKTWTGAPQCVDYDLLCKSVGGHHDVDLRLKYGAAGRQGHYWQECVSNGLGRCLARTFG